MEQIESIEGLGKRIAEFDQTCPSSARMIGAAAIPLLKELAASHEAEIRQLVIRCLAQIEGDVATEIIVSSLKDDDPVVAACAARELRRRDCSQHTQALINLYSRPAPEVLAETAMLLGEQGPSASHSDIRYLWENESIPSVHKHLGVALARLGDGDAQMWFEKEFGDAKEAVLLQYLEFARFIGQPWVLRLFPPLFSDHTPVMFTGLDNHPNIPQHFRVCEMAVMTARSIFSSLYPEKVNEMPAQQGAGACFTDEEMTANVRYLSQQSAFQT